jgi:hypothetical protein
MRVLAQKVSTDLSHPQDKRRFGELVETCFFESIPTDILSDDRIILNIHSDLTRFEDVKEKKASIIFDYCDMIHTRSPFAFYTMTLLWFIKGKISAPISRKKFRKILSEVDVLVVGSIAQKNICEKFRSKDIYVIEDYFDGCVFGDSAVNYHKGRGIVWEGLAGGNLFILLKCFRIAKLSGLNLTVVTDLVYPLFSGILKIRMGRVLRVISFLTQNKNFVLKKWTMTNFKLAAQEGEYILVPLNGSNSLEYYKPANKAALSLMMGLKPVLYSTPDYELFSSMICSTRSLCFKSTSEATELLSNYPELSSLGIEEYLNNRNREKLKLKWRVILS